MLVDLSLKDCPLPSPQRFQLFIIQNTPRCLKDLRQRGGYYAYSFSVLTTGLPTEK